MCSIISNAITGRDFPLLDSLKQDLKEATGVKLIISFLMETGAQLLIDDLKRLSNRGITISILTGRYLNVTEPSAIYLLKNELGSSLDIRFYRQQNISFHPKAYIIEMETDGVAYVGSSNLSRSALTTGIEWNFRLQKWAAPADYAVFEQTFDQMFEHEADPITDELLKKYANGWRKSIFSATDPNTEDTSEIRPRGAQIEALYCLSEARKEGITKGLVVAATGVGKTYLASFDSRKFSKVLFIAHKEEILLQAAASFKNVRPDNKKCALRSSSARAFQCP